MANVNYSTVIKNAIDGFNDIQNKLNSIGAKDANGTAIKAASTTTPLSITNMKGSDAFRKANISLSANVSGSGSTNLSGSNCTLEGNNTSGVSITGSGSVSATGTASGTVSQTGYINSNPTTASSSVKTLSAGSETQYLTGIKLTTGKKFNIEVSGKTWTANYDDSGNLVFT